MLTVASPLTKFLAISGQRKSIAREKYCEFVKAGIDTPSIWGNLEAQSILGLEGFAEGLRHLVKDKQWIREIPKDKDSPDGRA